MVEEGTLGNVRWAYYEDDTLVLSGKGAVPSYDSGEDFPWGEYARDAVEIIVEDGITSIGARAFYDFENVRTVTLPESLENIGADAFCNCYSVTKVIYDGSDSDWANVSVMSGNSAIAPKNDHGAPGDVENDDSSAQGSSSLGTIIEGDENADGEDNKYREALTVQDMSGREFYILERWFGYGKKAIDFSGEVIWNDEDEGELSLVDSAKKKVLEEIQEAYNCTITGEMSTATAGDFRLKIQEDVLGETGDYDICFDTCSYYFGLMEDGMLVDPHGLGIDYSDPWWEIESYYGLSMGSSATYSPNYFLTGDINTGDDAATLVCLFNKDLLKNHTSTTADELYELAENGSWTFEELKNLVIGFGEDSNYDNVMDEFDTYGLVTDTGNLYTHMLASGNRLVEKDSMNEPYYALPNNETAYNAILDAVDLYLNTDDVLVADLEEYITKYEGMNYYEHTALNTFKEGRGLFLFAPIVHLSYFSNMEDSFGLLPFPKYSAVQDRYYHTTQSHLLTTLFIPHGPNSTGESRYELGTIINALGAYSKDYVTPVYREKLLKRGLVCDSESAKMLDIVFDSVIYDAGYLFGSYWGTLATVTHLDKNVMSRAEASKDIIDLKVASTMEKIYNQ